MTLWLMLAAGQAPPDSEAVAMAAAMAAAAVLKTAEATRTGFSDPIVIAMIGTQVALVVGAIASGVALVLNRKDTKTLAEQQQINTAGLLTVAKDTEAIKGHVNSEKTAAEGRLNAALLESKLLREMLTEKQLTASLLAQASAARARSAPAVPPVATVVEEPLKVEVVNQPLAVVSDEKP